MSVAYLILAHREPDQVVRLVKRLRAQSDGPILVHIDRKARRRFETAVGAIEALPRVSAISSRRIYWGHFSIVQAALTGLHELLRSNPDVTHIKHLSGQDYPIKPLRAFEAHLAASGERSHMDLVALPAPWGPDGGYGRVLYPHVRRTRRLYVRIPIRRRLPSGIRFHGGSAFWCLARAHAEYVLAQTAPLQRFFRWADISDEMFFHTALMNSPHADEVADEELTHVSWPSGEAESPLVLDLPDLPALLASPAFFARKFAPETGAAILEALDRAAGCPPL